MEGFPMAVRLKSGKERAAVDREAVNALMETLVDPRLPRASSDGPPSEESQESVAKQMHAVVFLYNYYHRKQKPSLEFYTFRAFCKLAELLRPALSSFMKFTKETEPVELNDADSQLSLTEKAIKDACSIASSLDASKDVPATEGPPISKVAVLMIDSDKENCFLKYGTVTEGVWSLVEKEIDASSLSLDILAEQQGGKKRKTDNGQTSTYENMHLQIAYEAVKDANTDIVISDLTVLEAHVVHSLSKEKSAAQFFMMQYSQSFDIKDSVPLEELVDSLQGPLVEKNDNGWITTKLVEFHHVLPYVGFISSWLSRKKLSSPLLNGDEAQTTKNHDKRELLGSKDLGQVDPDWSGLKSNSADKVVNVDRENFQTKRKHSSAGKIASPVNVVQSTKEHGNVKDDFSDIRNLVTSKKGSKINFKKTDKNDETVERGYLSDPSRGRPRKTSKVNKDMAKECVGTHTRSSFKGKEEGQILSPKSPYHRRRKNAPAPQHDTHCAKNSVNLTVETAEPSKSNDRLCRDGQMTAEYGDASISIDQNGISSKENPLSESETSKNIGVGNATDSATLKNATTSHDLQKSKDSLGKYARVTADNGHTNMACNSGVENAIVTPTEKATAALLYKRSQELSSRICPLLDEQAACENAAERMLRGGVLDFASRCMGHILSGNEHLLLSEVQAQDRGHRPVEDYSHPQAQTRTRLLIPGKSSCQDLELICISNNLGLPKYTILLSSDGKYVAELTLQINGSVHRSESGSEPSPREARESCAADMISKISATYS